MNAAVGRMQDRFKVAHDPAGRRAREGHAEQTHRGPAGLERPVGAAIGGGLDRTARAHKTADESAAAGAAGPKTPASETMASSPSRPRVRHPRIICVLIDCLPSDKPYPNQRELRDRLFHDATPPQVVMAIVIRWAGAVAPPAERLTLRRRGDYGKGRMSPCRAHTGTPAARLEKGPNRTERRDHSRGTRQGGSGIQRRARYIGRRQMDHETYGLDVIAYTCDLGQGQDIQAIREKPSAPARSTPSRRTSATCSSTTSPSPRSWQARCMRASTRSPPRWDGRSSPSSWCGSPRSMARWPWPTAAPAKGMTRSAST